LMTVDGAVLLKVVRDCAHQRSREL
jgi:hypothetical protein